MLAKVADYRGVIAFYLLLLFFLFALSFQNQLIDMQNANNANIAIANN